MPPDKRKPPARDRRLSGDDVEVAGVDTSDHTLDIPILQLRRRPIGPGELASLRAMWWRQAGAGHRLPAEIGVIVVEGGAT